MAIETWRLPFPTNLSEIDPGQHYDIIDATTKKSIGAFVLFFDRSQASPPFEHHWFIETNHAFPNHGNVSKAEFHNLGQVAVPFDPKAFQKSLGFATKYYYYSVVDA